MRGSIVATVRFGTVVATDNARSVAPIDRDREILCVVFREQDMLRLDNVRRSI